MELTDKYVRALKVEKRTELADESYRPDTRKKRRGLLLFAEPGGSKTWYVRKKIAGKRFMKSIGSYPAITIAQARELLDQVDDHPEGPQAAVAEIHGQHAPQDVLTVKRLINRYIEEECEPYNRDWKNQEIVLERELQHHHELPAEELSTTHVLDIVQAALDRGSPRSAQEALKQIKGMYNWAMGKKRVRRQTVAKEAAKHALVRQVILEMPRNPAEGVIAPTYKPRSHHLEGKPLKGFLKKLRGSSLRDDCKLILEIQLQTFARVGEVAGMEWSELNLRKRVWAIPAARYKTGREHIVLLSKQTAKLLRKMERGESPYVFPMPRREDLPMTAADVGKEINKVRKSLKQHKDFSSHSLRHSGATWLASQHCPLEVRERLLGHVIDQQGDMSQRYQHHQFLDERKDWTQRWCDHLEEKNAK